MQFCDWSNTLSFSVVWNFVAYAKRQMFIMSNSRYKVWIEGALVCFTFIRIGNHSDRFSSFVFHFIDMHTFVDMRWMKERFSYSIYGNCPSCGASAGHVPACSGWVCECVSVRWVCIYQFFGIIGVPYAIWCWSACCDTVCTHFNRFRFRFCCCLWRYQPTNNLYPSIGKIFISNRVWLCFICLSYQQPLCLMPLWPISNVISSAYAE